MNQNNLFSNIPINFGSGTLNKGKEKQKGRKKKEKKNNEKVSEQEETKEEETKNSESEISVEGSIDLGKKSSKKVSLYKSVSIKRSNSLKNKPLFSEDLQTLTITKNQDNKNLLLKLDHEKYEFDMENPIIDKYFSENKSLKEILSRFDEFKIPYQKKQSVKISEISKITDHSYYTCLDCYFEHLNILILNKIKENDIENKIKSPAESELDRCCICQCDLYESILDYNCDKILSALVNHEDEEVIKLDKCVGHYFHKSCFLLFLKRKHILNVLSAL